VRAVVASKNDEILASESGGQLIGPGLWDLASLLEGCEAGVVKVEQLLCAAGSRVVWGCHGGSSPKIKVVLQDKEGEVFQTEGGICDESVDAARLAVHSLHFVVPESLPTDAAHHEQPIVESSHPVACPSLQVCPLQPLSSHSL
jgi:hypothetical protein